MKTRNHDDRTLLFPEGLVGLPDLKRWILADMDPPLPMKWLESQDRAGFRVPVTDPGFYIDDYAFEVDDAAQEHLRTAQPSDLVVMIISTVAEGGAQVTGNLSAPLVVHTGTRRGVQVVLSDGRWSMRHGIDPDRFGAACRAYLEGHPENVTGTAVDKVMADGYAEAAEEEETRVPIEIP